LRDKASGYHERITPGRDLLCNPSTLAQCNSSHSLAHAQSNVWVLTKDSSSCENWTDDIIHSLAAMSFSLSTSETHPTYIHCLRGYFSHQEYQQNTLYYNSLAFNMLMNLTSTSDQNWKPVVSKWAGRVHVKFLIWIPFYSFSFSLVLAFLKAVSAKEIKR